VAQASAAMVDHCSDQLADLALHGRRRRLRTQELDDAREALLDGDVRHARCTSTRRGVVQRSSLARRCYLGLHKPRG
jgi:hypothetical protein